MFGQTSCSLSHCYASGDVTGNNVVGGLVGRSFPTYAVTTSECFSVSKITANATTDVVAGGLFGRASNQVISYSYYANNALLTKGIVGESEDGYGAITLTNCFTASNSFGINTEAHGLTSKNQYSDSADTNSKCGVPSIRDNYELLNAGPTAPYSNTTWADNDYSCPKFGAYSSDIEIPNLDDGGTITPSSDSTSDSSN